MESQQIITVTPDQLQRMIDAGVDRAIDRVVPKLADYILNVEKQEKPDRMSIEQAIEFLAEHGYPLSRQAIYQRTCNKTIPHERLGNRRLSFSRRRLAEWVEQEASAVKTADESLEEAGRLISEQSKRKTN